MCTRGRVRERDLLVLVSGKKQHEAAMGVHPPWSSCMILCRALSVGRALIDTGALSHLVSRRPVPIDRRKPHGLATNSPEGCSSASGYSIEPPPTVPGSGGSGGSACL